MSKGNIVLIVILVIGIIGWLFIKFNGVSKGSSVPNFSAELIDGTDFQLSDLKGQYVLIDFWGSWCPPCRAENPKLVKLYSKYNNLSYKAAEGFEIVSIALEKNDRTLRAAAKKDGFNWKYQIVQQSKFVVMSPLARQFGVTDLPTKLLIDSKGNLVGQMSLSEIEAYLDSKLDK